MTTATPAQTLETPPVGRTDALVTLAALHAAMNQLRKALGLSILQLDLTPATEDLSWMEDADRPEPAAD